MKPRLGLVLGLPRPVLPHARRRYNIPLNRTLFSRTAKKDAVVQTIRFRRERWYSANSTLKYVLWFAAVILPLKHVVGPHVKIVFEDIPEEEEKKDDKDVTKPGLGTGVDVTDDEVDMDEGDFFLPLTTATQQPRKYYKGSDPEWQEFIKVAKDKDRQSKLCEELKGHVQKIVAWESRSSSTFSGHPLGRDISVGKHWIDFHFPDGPPPEHAREGLLVTDGKISWGSELIDDETYQALAKRIWPEHIINGFIFTFGRALRTAYHTTKSSLGLKEDPKSDYAKETRQIDRVMKTFQAGRKKLAAAAETSEPRQAKPPANAFQNVQDLISASLATDIAKDQPWLDRAIAVWQVGRLKSYAKRSRTTEPPRGTFVMIGLIEVKGSGGRMMLDTTSIYDPQQAKFSSIKIQIRTFTRWNRRPKGGA